jgi:hypothetical protein
MLVFQMQESCDVQNPGCCTLSLAQLADSYRLFGDSGKGGRNKGAERGGRIKEVGRKGRNKGAERKRR